MLSTIKRIVDPEIRKGEGTKGEWVQALVELENGKEVRIFQPIEVGDKVEDFQNGDYRNWRKVKVSAEGAQVMKALEMIYKQNKDIIESIDTLNAMLVDFAEKTAPRASSEATDEELSDNMDETMGEEESPMPSGFLR